ncbi:MAG: TolC family protein [Planctomycetota bacterium]
MPDASDPVAGVENEILESSWKDTPCLVDEDASLLRRRNQTELKPLRPRILPVGSWSATWCWVALISIMGCAGRGKKPTNRWVAAPTKAPAVASPSDKADSVTEAVSARDLPLVTEDKVNDGDPKPARLASFRSGSDEHADLRTLMQSESPVRGESPGGGGRAAEITLVQTPRVGSDGIDPSAFVDSEIDSSVAVLDSDESAPTSVPERSLLDGLMPDEDEIRSDELEAYSTETLQLPDVVVSVKNFFPVVQSAFLERQRTSGDQLAAWGAFDTKTKAYTENQPLGFYENYQHGAGLVQPRYRGGEVYGGYRIGRGIFEPWYLERETNKGGEFKVGFDLPLVRDREIDKRRADLWRATYDRQLAEPEIRLQIIGAVLDAKFAYWIWVASGQQYKIGLAALELAEKRNRQVARRVEEGDLGAPSLADNDRAIALRKAKLLDRQRKLQQSAVKLSLFIRDADTLPLIPPIEVLPTLPTVDTVDMSVIEGDIQMAIARRPEIEMVDVLYQRTQVDLAEACNETLPAIDALMNVSQDVGERTSSKGDKSEFELEAGFTFDMPVQRRKGRGKMRSARAKLQQLQIKRQFESEKIGTQVRAAGAALQAAYGRVQESEISVKLAERLAEVARRQFELGESDLLNVFLREQFAIEAADALVIAKLDYFLARAEYDAAIALTD